MAGTLFQSFLGGPPFPVEGLQCVVLEGLSGRQNCGLHVPKPGLEFEIRSCQRLFRIDIEVSCQVDDREQQIAEFLFDLGRFP